MNISISFCGDILISRRLPSKVISGEISDFLLSHDCRIGNLETTIHRRQGYPAAYPGGGYSMADPLCLKDLKDFGFNLFSTANNHAMDYSCNGLLATINNLQEYEIPFSGTGVNLQDASRPAFFECNEGRIAMLSVTSSFHDSYMAGPQNQDMQGRPGVSPLRHTALYELSEKNYDDLTRIAKESGINAYHDMGIKSGYLTSTPNLRFGQYQFKKGTKNCVHTLPNEEDLLRTLNLIKDAKYSSDIIIVSVHSHQFLGLDKSKNAEFVSSFSRNCIDAGADIVTCHGPHKLRGIEVYNGGLIFHSLGNFIFQHELVEFVPEELYNRYGLSRQTSTGVNELFRKRSKNGKVGIKTMKECYISIIGSVHINDCSMNVQLIPIEIDVDSGLPSFSKDSNILKKLIVLSEDFKTNIKIDSDNNTGMIHVHR